MAKRKAAPGWRRVFLRVLARTGNVRAAAREAGVDVTTAYTHRGRDAGFAARWEQAKGPLDPSTSLGRAYARDERRRDYARDERGIDRPSPQPSPASGRGGKETSGRGGKEAGAEALPLHRLRRSPSPAKAGEEMVLRHSKREGAQWVKAGEGRWSAKAEAAFFAELGRTACVRRAAAACGFSTTALYKRRGKYAEFAARWDAIEERAKQRIHGFLVSSTIATFDPELEGEGLPRVSIKEGIAIYRLKGPGSPLGAGEKLGGRCAAEEPSIEAVRDEVLARLAAMRAQREGGGGGETSFGPPSTIAFGDGSPPRPGEDL